VDVPLPLRLGVMELPVVGDELGLAELAAGSPVMDPAPLGAPLCAYAKEPHSVSAAASAIGVSFTPFLSDGHDNSERESRVPPLFGTIEPLRSTAFAKSLNPPAIGFYRVHCKATQYERMRRPARRHCIRSSGP